MVDFAYIYAPLTEWKHGCCFWSRARRKPTISPKQKFKKDHWTNTFTISLIGCAWLFPNTQSSTLLMLKTHTNKGNTPVNHETPLNAFHGNCQGWQQHGQTKTWNANKRPASIHAQTALEKTKTHLHHARKIWWGNTSWGPCLSWWEDSATRIKGVHGHT